MLIIRHDINLCGEFFERMVVMCTGHIAEQARFNRIAADASEPYTIGLLRCVPRLESATLDRLSIIQGDYPGVALWQANISRASTLQTNAA